MADGERIKRIARRLLAAPETVEDLDSLIPDWRPHTPAARPPVEAAVLIALIDRGEEHSVLFTKRSSDLRSHSGQIAFPGGKIDPGDDGPGAAALREANEEVAMLPQDATILGYMPPYFTGTNYLITPVVAEVVPSAPFVPNPREVDSVFEIPLSFIADLESYGTYLVERGNLRHETWQVLHDEEVIWGITANLTRRFRDLALHEEEDW